jgi:hypothetical protein
MNFTSPTPFAAAIASREVKALLPTDLNSAQLAQLPADLRERAVFSAKVSNADFLQKINDLTTRIVSPETIRGPDSSQVSGFRSQPSGPGQYMDIPTARLALKQQLLSLNYQPTTEQRGTITDLSSDARLNLILSTNTQMAQGYAAWFRDQSPSTLEAVPAQELYRLEDRKERRPWGQIWNNAIQSLGSATTGIPVEDLHADSGMFALKNDPIWTAISIDFGLPYPPFAFGSGMWTRDVSLSEAQDLGLVNSPDDIPDPDLRGFNDGLEATITDLAPLLQQALETSLKGLAVLKDGVLSLI